jgi:hypothetical protein
MQTPGNKWMIALEVAGDAVANLPAGTQIALVIFDEKIVESLDFGSGRRTLAQRIIALASRKKAVPSKSRRTAIWDSLLKALPVFSARQPGDVVYLISDGGENVSKTRPRQIEDAFLREGTRLFAFLLVDRSPRGSQLPDEEEQGLSILKELTEVTGGNYVILPGIRPLAHPNFDLSEEGRRKLALSAQVLYAEMKEFSRIDVVLPERVDKTRDWSLQLNRSSHKKFRLLYPHKLTPCSPPQAAAPSPALL